MRQSAISDCGRKTGFANVGGPNEPPRSSPIMRERFVRVLLRFHEIVMGGQSSQTEHDSQLALGWELTAIIATMPRRDGFFRLF
jgi:hypothetical protein